MSKISSNDFNPKIHVKEYKRKCNECGKVWHSLADREKRLKDDVTCNACTQSSTAFNGNMNAALQAKRNVEAGQTTLDSLKKCPNCGSSNYKEEVIIYEKK